jgi:hypothetical protein
MKAYTGSGGKVILILNLGNKRKMLRIGVWVGPRAGLIAVEKRKISFFCRESNPSF